MDVDRPINAPLDGERVRAAGLEHLGHHQLGAWRHALGQTAIGQAAGDQARHVGAVADLVGDIGAAGEGVVGGQYLALERGVGELQARIHHADRDAGAVAGTELVGIRRAELGQPALVGAGPVFSDGGRGLDQRGGRGDRCGGLQRHHNIVGFRRGGFGLREGGGAQGCQQCGVEGV